MIAEEAESSAEVAGVVVSTFGSPTRRMKASAVVISRRVVRNRKEWSVWSIRRAVGSGTRSASALVNGKP